MVNKSKAKGTAAETAFVKYLRDEWNLPFVERRALSGTGDRGDIAGIPGVVLEIKDAEKKKMPEWQSQTLAEMSNDGAYICALIIKVPRKHRRDWEAWVPLWLLSDHEGVYGIWVKMLASEFMQYLNHHDYIGERVSS